MRSVQSSYRDRTQEFESIAERLNKSITSSTNGPSSAAVSQPNGSKSTLSAQSEFNKRACKIGFGIHQTSQKLAKLAKLAKRTSVFDDPTLEIQELTAVIKQDITALNAAVLDLQLLCNTQNESGNISSDTTSHSTTVVDNLKNRLMTATKEFKEVLTMRTEHLKVHENRKQLFSSTASKGKSIHSSASIGSQISSWWITCPSSVGQCSFIIILIISKKTSRWRISAAAAAAKSATATVGSTAGHLHAEQS